MSKSDHLAQKAFIIVFSIFQILQYFPLSTILVSAATLIFTKFIIIQVKSLFEKCLENGKISTLVSRTQKLSESP